MVRCTICDWSPLTSSEFYGSLYVHGSHKLLRDRRSGNLYCDSCFEEIRGNYQEMKGLDDDDWNGIRSSNEHLFSDTLEAKKEVIED